MQKSETIAELAKALLGFQAEMKTVIFDASNPFFKSKYATLAQIVSSSKEAMVHHGLSISQLVEGEGGVTTILMHTSGEYLSSTLTLRAVKDDPQGHGSAITYARRYAYASILGIVTDEDDDVNAATMPQKRTETAQGYANNTKTSDSTAKEKESLKLNPSDEERINKEQGNSLIALLKKNGWTLQDLKEYIFFEFELEKVELVCNKHLLQIKEAFSKPKEEK